jgi:glycine cleavage system aminomethyltransferase T
LGLISAQNDLGVEMKNLSDDYSLLAIQGPKAVEAQLTSKDLSAIPYYHFEGRFCWYRKRNYFCYRIYWF